MARKRAKRDKASARDDVDVDAFMDNALGDEGRALVREIARARAGRRTNLVPEPLEGFEIHADYVVDADGSERLTKWGKQRQAEEAKRKKDSVVRAKAGVKRTKDARQGFFENFGKNRTATPDEDLLIDDGPIDDEPWTAGDYRDMAAQGAGPFELAEAIARAIRDVERVGLRIERKLDQIAQLLVKRSR